MLPWQPKYFNVFRDGGGDGGGGAGDADQAAANATVAANNAAAANEAMGYGFASPSDVAMAEAEAQAYANEAQNVGVDEGPGIFGSMKAYSIPWTEQNAPLKALSLAMPVGPSVAYAAAKGLGAVAEALGIPGPQGYGVQGPADPTDSQGVGTGAQGANASGPSLMTPTKAGDTTTNGNDQFYNSLPPDWQAYYNSLSPEQKQYFRNYYSPSNATGPAPTIDPNGNPINPTTPTEPTTPAPTNVKQGWEAEYSLVPNYKYEIPGIQDNYTAANPSMEGFIDPTTGRKGYRPKKAATQ